MGNQPQPGPPKRGTAPNFPSTAIVAAAVCKLGAEVGLGLGDFVLAGDPVFGSCPLWPNGWMDEDDTWYGSRPRPHCVRWGTSSPQKEHSLQFSDHVYCGQTAGWMKTPLGTEVNLSPGHIVLDGDPAPLRKGHSSPPLSFLFGPMSIMATVAHLSYC